LGLLALGSHGCGNVATGTSEICDEMDGSRTARVSSDSDGNDAEPCNI